MLVGTIKLFAGGYLPEGWLYCNGSSVSKVTYPDLYQAIGTTYGGDGQPNFSVPNMSGRVPVCVGQSANTALIALGQSGGVYEHALSVEELCEHSHQLLASDVQSTVEIPSPDVQLAIPATIKVENKVSTNGYTDANVDISLHAETIGYTGGSKAHDNIQPYLCMSYIICFINMGLKKD